MFATKLQKDWELYNTVFDVLFWGVEKFFNTEGRSVGGHRGENTSAIMHRALPPPIRSMVGIEVCKICSL